jgi:hypothetical protein
MASTIEELLVKVTPEGVQETEEELDGVSNSFSEAEAVADETADSLGGVAQRLTGAVSAVVVGLGAAAAGLLSKVPILGQAAAGLETVVNSVALLIDETLRPVLEPLSSALSDLSTELIELEGPLRDFASILLTTAGVGGFFLGIIYLIAGALSGPVVAGVLAVVGAMAVLVQAWKNNWFNIRDILRLVWDVIKDIIRRGIDFIKGLWSGLQDVLAGDWEGVWVGILEFTEDILNGLVDGFIDFGGMAGRVLGKFGVSIRKLFEKVWNRLRVGWEILFDFIVKAVKEGGNLAVQAAEDFTNGIIGMVNSAISAIETMINKAAEVASETPGVNISPVQFSGIGQVSAPTPFETRTNQEIQETARQRTRRRDRQADRDAQQRSQEIDQQVNELVQAMQQQEITLVTNLDSQQVAEETEPFLDRNVQNRGR